VVGVEHHSVVGDLADAGGVRSIADHHLSYTIAARFSLHYHEVILLSFDAMLTRTKSIRFSSGMSV
jgi:hypothetical protein